MAEYPIPNAESIRTVRVHIQATNRAIKLPHIEVPDDMELVIKASPINPAGSEIWVGGDRPAALSADSSWPLVPNEAKGWRVKNATNLYVSGVMIPWPAAGLACFVSVEQRRNR